MTASLSERIFNVEAATLALVEAVGSGLDPSENEEFRLYVLREKLEKIIAGDSRQVYENAQKKWYDDRELRCANVKSA